MPNTSIEPTELIFAYPKPQYVLLNDGSEKISGVTLDTRPYTAVIPPDEDNIVRPIPESSRGKPVLDIYDTVTGLPLFIPGEAQFLVLTPTSYGFISDHLPPHLPEPTGNPDGDNFYSNFLNRARIPSKEEIEADLTIPPLPTAGQATTTIIGISPSFVRRTVIVGGLALLAAGALFAKRAGLFDSADDEPQEKPFDLVENLKQKNSPISELFRQIAIYTTSRDIPEEKFAANPEQALDGIVDLRTINTKLQSNKGVLAALFNVSKHFESELDSSVINSNNDVGKAIEKVFTNAPARSQDTANDLMFGFLVGSNAQPTRFGNTIVGKEFLNNWKGLKPTAPVPTKHTEPGRRNLLRLTG